MRPASPRSPPPSGTIPSWPRRTDMPADTCQAVHDGPVYWECVTCGFLSHDPAFADVARHCPACGSASALGGSSPPSDFAESTSASAATTPTASHEVVVILVATFLESLMEDMLARIMAAEGASVQLRAAVLDTHALGRPAHRQALPDADRRSSSRTPPPRPACPSSPAGGARCAPSATRSSTTRRSRARARRSAPRAPKRRSTCSTRPTRCSCTSTTGSSPASEHRSRRTTRVREGALPARHRHRPGRRASGPSSTTSRSSAA